jgi:hypothetical protein
MGQISAATSPQTGSLLSGIQQTSNCAASSASVFSPFTAASATLALKAGLWFRRGRLVMVSPVHGIMPLSGRKYTYPRCSDFPSQLSILVPSRFEPCGLTQLCAQRYGALPIVAHTGGLADTVVDANRAALGRGWGTGFSFAPDNLESLCEAIARTGSIWRDRVIWQSLLENAMRTDVSWARSARCYASILRSLSNVD